jgi:hypothetical protein
MKRESFVVVYRQKTTLQVVLNNVSLTCVDVLSLYTVFCVFAYPTPPELVQIGFPIHGNMLLSLTHCPQREDFTQRTSTFLVLARSEVKQHV